MVGSHLLLVLSWIVYFFLHSFLAHGPVKTRIQQRMGANGKYYRFAYSLVALLLLAPPLYLLTTQRSILLFRPSPWTSIPGAALAAIGLAGAMICLKKYIGSKEGFRDLFYEGLKPELQVKGFHRYVRHPLYLSTFICLAGVLLMFPYLSCLVSYLLIVIYVVLAIPLEEKKLAELYGEQYRAYQKQVGALIPKI